MYMCRSLAPLGSLALYMRILVQSATHGCLSDPPMRWTGAPTCMRSTADSRWRTDDDGTLLMPQGQAAFLDWLLSDVKSPPSQARYAVENDVNERTIQTWKRDPRFVAEWEKRLQEKNISPERIQDVVETIYMAAKNGDVKAATAYIAYVEKFLPTPEKQTNDQTIRGMSDAELDERLKDFVE